MGSFQYLRLYIWPPPGMTSASHRARCGLGRHVLQSRCCFMPFVLFSSPMTKGFACPSSSSISSSSSSISSESVCISSESPGMAA